MNSESRKRKSNDQIQPLQHDQFLSERAVSVQQQSAAGAKSDEGKEVLLEKFSLGQFDVNWSRGKDVKTHSGNVFFQSLINKAVPRYSSTEGKLGKSRIVSEIIDTIRTKSPHGGFVKKVGEQWFLVGDLITRERVSQTLRDQLHCLYQSSASSKRRRKDEQNAQMLTDIQAFVHSSPFISQRMNNLSSILQRYGDHLSDQQIEILMTQVNSDVLGHLKTDGALLQMATRLQERR